LLQESASGPYFLGEQFSLADIAIAPFVLRLYAFTSNFVARDFEFEQVKANPRLAEFIKGITSRPSVEATYIGDAGYAELIGKRFNLTKL
jgi:glutathione S-transferase